MHHSTGTMNQKLLLVKTRRTGRPLPQPSGVRWGRRPGDGFSCRGGGVLSSAPAPLVTSSIGSISDGIRSVKGQATKAERRRADGDFLLTQAETRPTVRVTSRLLSTIRQASVKGWPRVIACRVRRHHTWRVRQELRTETLPLGPEGGEAGDAAVHRLH
jgi:hypothetical protein